MKFTKVNSILHHNEGSYLKQDNKLKNREKDLGVSMNANMKVSEQCRIAASKGNQVLGMIRRNITYKEEFLYKGVVVLPLYKGIVRPHLEYCILAWRPYLRKDIDML